MKGIRAEGQVQGVRVHSCATSPLSLPSLTAPCMLSPCSRSHPPVTPPISPAGTAVPPSCSSASALNLPAAPFITSSLAQTLDLLCPDPALSLLSHPCLTFPALPAPAIGLVSPLLPLPGRASTCLANLAPTARTGQGRGCINSCQPRVRVVARTHLPDTMGCAQGA